VFPQKYRPTSAKISFVRFILGSGPSQRTSTATAANYNYSRHHPDNEKTNIRERTHNTQQHQGLLNHRVKPGAAHISRKCIFFLAVHRRRSSLA